jgi:hypothetical protein
MGQDLENPRRALGIARIIKLVGEREELRRVGADAAAFDLAFLARGRRGGRRRLKR